VDDEDKDAPLAGLLSAIANPLRLRLVRRLQRPAFVPDLTKEFGLTRQSLKKHLDDLESAGIVVASMRKRGLLPASEYATDPAGFFALREMVADLGLAQGMAPASRPTRFLGTRARQPAHKGPGLLMVHGDQPGRWFPLQGSECVLGRDPEADLALPYDGFASKRHAMLHADRAGRSGWRVTDLQSRNGTAVNFVRLARGASVALANGDVLTVGRTHLVLRSTEA